MCGISGFCCFDTDFNKNYNKWHNVLVDMRESLAHRGKDETGEYLKKNIGLSHTRLSIRDLYNGNQPMIKTINNVEYAIVYNGEIYDTEALKAELEKKGYVFDGTSDTEIILYSFIEYGKKCVEKLNGIFAFCIWHSGENKLYLFRDRSGVKPLFYTIENNTLIFASEIKALFCHPYVTPEININSFREIFGIGPARTEGFGVFKNIYEIKYGHYGEFSINGFTEKAYWKLSTLKTNHNYEETVQNVNQLITSAVEYQMVSDVPVCSFLSGGVDSCIVTALASNHLQKQGKTLNTFSFDFTDNNKYFKSNSFQPEQDRPYVDIMLKEYNLNHTYLECSNEELADMLYCSVDAKDLPGMADVDASMLYFCKFPFIFTLALSIRKTPKFQVLLSSNVPSSICKFANQAVPSAVFSTPPSLNPTCTLLLFFELNINSNLVQSVLPCITSECSSVPFKHICAPAVGSLSFPTTFLVFTIQVIL